jgi:hypothetical protein
MLHATVSAAALPSRLQPHKATKQSCPLLLQGSACFLFGFVLVVWGWAIIGFVVETYGFFLLFRGFFPTVLSFLRSVPFLGRLLDAPALKTVSCRLQYPLICSLYVV